MRGAVERQSVWRLALPLLLGVGCVGPSPVGLGLDRVSGSPPAKSAVLAFVSPGSPPSYQALALEGGASPPITIWFREGAHAEVALFAATLSGLQIAPGPIAPQDGASRPLPAGTRYTAPLDGGPLRWVRTASPGGSALGSLLLPPFDERACVNGGGCPLSEGGMYCAIPCPDRDPPSPPLVPVPPVLPDKPIFGPNCPMGWTYSSTAAYCLPPPPIPDVSSTCARADEAQFYGEGTCTKVGPPCPPGDFDPALPDDGTTIFVKIGAASPGNGSRAMPYPLLQDALAALAGRNATIALSRGVHVGSVAFGDGMVIIGACSGETYLSQPDTAVSPIVAGGNVRASVKHLHVSGGMTAIYAYGGASLAIEDVIVDPGAEHGLIALSGASIRARNFVVRGRTLAGIAIEDGRTGDFDRIVLESNVQWGFLLFQSTPLGMSRPYARLTRAVIRDSSDSAILPGVGVGVFGADLEASGLEILRTTQYGMLVGTGGRTVIDDARIGSTHHPDPQTFSVGVSGVNSASIAISRAVIEDTGGAGVGLTGTVTARLTDVLIQRAIYPWGGTGEGIFVEKHSSLTLERVRLDANRTAAIRVGSPEFPDTYHGDCPMTVERADDSQLSARDLVVQRTGGWLGIGTGLLALDGTRVHLERARFEGNNLQQIVIHGGRAVADLRDLTLSGRISDADVPTGNGLFVCAGSNVRAGRLLVSGVSDRAIQILASTSTLSDVTVVNSGIAQRASVAIGGLLLHNRSQVTVERASIADSRGSGMMVVDFGTVVNARDIEVASMWPEQVPPTVVPLARGVLVAAQASFVLAKAKFTKLSGGAVDCDGSTCTLSNVSISECEGEGLRTSDGQTSAEHLAVSGASGDGIYASGLHGRVDLRAVHVQGTRFPGSLTDDRRSDVLGAAIHAKLGVDVCVDDFLFEQSFKSAVALDPGDRMTLSRGEIAREDVAILDKAGQVKLDMLLRDVRFVGVGEGYLLDR